MRFRQTTPSSVESQLLGGVSWTGGTYRSTGRQGRIDLPFFSSYPAIVQETGYNHFYHQRLVHPGTDMKE
ncbi:hypothetical protein [Methanospirillum hungatei]|uniref:hypothetical protein n=1 Tax=Methanospirillum hungatei TaxID=2203 RepID=UPI0026EDB603|nr:hypothetical protein [Methanospirillum hungatei]MCA1915958.1 hypothetical protein [Methanospirillum hungatei]